MKKENITRILQGKINALSFPGASLQKLKAPDGSDKLCVIIPVDDLPSAYATMSNKNGVPACYIDIRIRQLRTPNEKTGNTHIISLDVGTQARQRYGIQTQEQLRDATPIIGDLKLMEFRSSYAPAAPDNQDSSYGGYSQENNYDNRPGPMDPGGEFYQNR